MTLGSKIRLMGLVADMAVFIGSLLFLPALPGFVIGVILATICGVITERCYNRYADEKEKIDDLEDRVRNGDV